jgi:hypothetical protein
MGPAYAWVFDASGRRYLTDESNHRVVIEHPDGHAEIVGCAGTGAGEFQSPQGLALLPAPSPGDARLFVCDTLNHRVQVLDGRGLPIFAFGRFGHGPGQFAAPADVAIVTPQLPGDTPEQALAQPLLAVADQWNARIQVLTLDGVPVASIGGTRETRASAETSGAGWPFFRLAAHPVLRVPAHVRWDAPVLEVTCGNGRRVPLDLALAMLPTFEAWLLSSSQADRDRALRYFSMARAGARVLPQSVVEAIAAGTATVA